MTFDLAQMIADREAGTPGPWRSSQTWRPPIGHGPHNDMVNGNVFSGYSVSGSNESGGHIYPTLAAVHNFPENIHANARRIARVPLLEAEIIRLTARVAELEGDAAEFRSAAMWTKHAAEALDGYEADYGEPLPLIHEIGRIPDSRKTASFRIYPNHIRGLADLLKPRAALSTHTEEPKT